MYLDSGSKIYGNDWTILPVTEEVVARVHHFGTEQKQKPVKNGNFDFEWEPDLPITHDPAFEDDDDEISVETVEEMEPTTDDAQETDMSEIPVAVDNETIHTELETENIEEQRSDNIPHKIEEVIDDAGVAEIIVEEEAVSDRELDDEVVPTIEINDISGQDGLHAHDILEDQRSAELLNDVKSDVLSPMGPIVVEDVLDGDEDVDNVQEAPRVTTTPPS